MIEERALELHDRSRDFEDRLLALVDRFHQPSRRAQALRQVFPRLGCDIDVVEHPLVVTGQPKARHRVAIERHDVVFADFLNINVGHDVGRLRTAVVAARLGLEQRDDFSRLPHRFDRHAENLGDFRVAMLFEQIEMVLHDSRRERLFHPEVLQLREQAFAQIARGDSGRIEALQAAEHALDFGGRDFELRRHLVHGSLEISVFVQVVDDRCADFLIGSRSGSTAGAATSCVLRANFAESEYFRARCDGRRRNLNPPACFPASCSSRSPGIRASRPSRDC